MGRQRAPRHRIPEVHGVADVVLVTQPRKLPAGRWELSGGHAVGDLRARGLPRHQELQRQGRRPELNGRDPMPGCANGRRQVPEQELMGLIREGDREGPRRAGSERGNETEGVPKTGSGRTQLVPSPCLPIGIRPQNAPNHRLADQRQGDDRGFGREPNGALRDRHRKLGRHRDPTRTGQRSGCIRDALIQGRGGRTQDRGAPVGKAGRKGTPQIVGAGGPRIAQPLNLLVAARGQASPDRADPPGRAGGVPLGPVSASKSRGELVEIVPEDDPDRRPVQWRPVRQEGL